MQQRRRRRARAPAACAGSGAQHTTITATSRAVATSCEVRGSRADVSNTTRVGATRGGGTSRTVSSGSSASTVPMPTAIASAPARRRCTSRARHFAGDPARPARVIGERAVERERELEPHERAVARQRVEERRIELARRRLLDADVHLDARRRAALGSAARHGVRIADAATTRRTPAARMRVGARRRVAVMIARLERDVQRRAARDDVRHPRAVQSSGQDAAMHRRLLAAGARRVALPRGSKP